MPAQDSEIIDKIGEEALIAAGFRKHSIKQWRYRGIMWMARDEIRELAEQRGIELPSDFVRHKRAPRAGRAKLDKVRKSKPRKARAA